MADLDWEALARRLMDTVSSPTDAQTYQGAPYTSRDPGTSRYRSGEVTSDVGLLDPVDLLAQVLAPYLLPGLKTLPGYGRQALTAWRNRPRPSWEPPRTTLPTREPLPSYPVEPWPEGVDPAQLAQSGDEGMAPDPIDTSMSNILDTLHRILGRREPLSDMRVPTNEIPSVRIPARQPMRETVRSHEEEQLAAFLEELRQQKASEVQYVWDPYRFIMQLLAKREQ